METLFKESKEKMQKTVNSLENEYASIRAGRANPAVLNKILVDYYGTPTPVNQMASVSVAEARVLVIQPWDISLLKNIEKAINTSDIGINPQNDGKVIRLNFPQLTEERRKELVKDIKKIAEDSKISIRNNRREVLDKLKAMQKKSEITEDDLKDAEDRMQKQINKFHEEIEKLEKEKEKEIMSI